MSNQIEDDERETDERAVVEPTNGGSGDAEPVAHVTRDDLKPIERTLTGVLIVAFGAAVAASSEAFVMNISGFFIAVVGVAYGFFLSVTS